MTPAVHLGSVNAERHLSLVAIWLHRPQVARWWGDPELALGAIRQHPIDQEALIYVDDRPVGFVCWQIPPREELAAAGLTDLPSDLVDVDIFIGEPEVLGQGVGPAALSQLLARLQAEGVKVVGLATSVANSRALKAYEKAGFRAFRDFHEAGDEMRYLVQQLSTAV